MPVAAHRSGWTALITGLAVGLAAAAAAVPPASAEGVLQRVARSGELQMVGPASHPPMLSLDAQGRPQGYGALVAQRIADLVG